MGNSIIEREKQIITSMMRKLSQGKIPEEYIKANIEEIFMLEVQKNMGYRYIPVYSVLEDKDGQIVTTDEVTKYVNNKGNDIHLNFVHNDIEKDLSGNFEIVKDYSGNEHPTVTLNLAAYNIEKIASDNATERMSGYRELMHTLFHENQHAQENWMNKKNILSKDAFRYAKDRILISALEKKWYSYDDITGNYESYAIENGANKTALERYYKIMGEDAESDIREKIIIMRGKFHLNRYKVNADLRDKSTHYQSNGSEERDDITDPIIDDLICRKRKLELLEEYPILQEKYTLDGEKRSAVEIIKRMQQRIAEIEQNPKLSPKAKKINIDSNKEFYYELIYNRLMGEFFPERIAEEIGEKETKELLEGLSQYFQKEKEEKIKVLGKMLLAQNKTNEWIEPSNNGRIDIESSYYGSPISVNRKEYTEYMCELYPEEMEKKYTVRSDNGETKTENGKKILERIFENLPERGLFKTETEEVNASIIIASYLDFLEKEGPIAFKRYLRDFNISVDYKKQFNTSSKRILSYYNQKQDFIAGVSNKIFEGQRNTIVPRNKIVITPKDIQSTLNNYSLGWSEIIKTASMISETEKSQDNINQER